MEPFLGTFVASAARWSSIRMQKLFTLGFVALLTAAGLAVLPTVAAAPAITDVQPPTGTANGGTEITIFGSDFADGSIVELDTAFDAGPESSAIRAHVTSWASTQIKAITPPHAAGAVGVRIISPTGNVATAFGEFSYTAASTPTVTSVSPSGGRATGGELVDVIGTNFAVGSDPPQVTFSGSNALVVAATATKLTVLTPAHAVGNANVIVTNPLNAASAACANCFAWQDVAAPSITQLNQVQGPRSGGTPLTITGTGFAAGAKVFFDATAATACDSAGGLAPASSVSFVSSTSLVAITPARLAAEAANQRVCVINPDGDAASNPPFFTYIDATTPESPTITAVSPTKGPVYGGTIVTITGTNFHKAANAKPTVLFDTLANCEGLSPILVPAGDVSVDTTSSITIRTPTTAAAGTAYFVKVENPDGLFACAPASFQFITPLEITDLSQKSGPATGGIGTSVSPVDQPNTPLDIHGTGFATSGMRVFFGAVEGKVTASTAIKVSAIPPPQPVVGGGAVQVVVTRPDGQSASFWKYTYTTGAAIQIDDVTPRAAGDHTTNGGTTLTINNDSPVFAFGPDPDGPGPAQPALPTVLVGTVTAEVKRTVPDSSYPVGLGNPCGGTDLLGTFGRCRYPTGLVSSFSILMPVHASALSSADVKVTNPDGRSDTSADANERVSSTNGDMPAVGDIVHCRASATSVVDDSDCFSASGGYFGSTRGGTMIMVTGDLAEAQNGFLGTPSNFFVGNFNDPEAKKPVVKVGGITVPANQVFPVANGGTLFGMACETPTIELDVGNGDCLVIVVPPYTAATSVANQAITVTNPDGRAGTGSGAGGFDYDNAATANLQATPAPTFTSFTSDAFGPSNGGKVVRIAGTNFGPVTNAVRGNIARPLSDGTNSVLDPCADSDNDDEICESNFNGNRLATPVPEVLFDGIAGTQVRVVSSTELFVRAPPHAPTAPLGVSVVIRNPDGQSVTASAQYRYDNSPSPTIATISSPSSSFVGGTLVTITGTNFPTRSATTDNSRDADNQDCLADPIAQAVAGVDKTQFVTPRPVLRFGGTLALEVCVLDENTLRAYVPAHAPGEVTVQMDNPDGDSTSSGGLFTYLPIVPVAQTLSVSTAPGNGGGAATINGLNFAVGDQVYVQRDQASTAAGGRIAKVNSVSGTAVAVELPSGTAGPADVKVVDREGQSSTLDSPLTYLPALPPQAKSVATRFGSVNGNTEIAIEGAGFANGAIVRIDNDVSSADADTDIPASSVAVSPDGKRLTFASPNFMRTDDKTFGPLDVLICNPSVTSCASSDPNALFLPDVFGYAAIAGPTVTSVTPNHGPPEGGTAVTILGTGFFSGATVKFDTTSATDVVIVSPTQITAKSPAHAAGPVKVEVDSGGQKGLLNNGFTYDGLTSTSDTTTSGTTTPPTTTATTTTPPATTGPLPTTGAPTVPTAAEIEAANKQIELTVTRDGTSNVLEWDLPPASQLPLPVAGVQIHASNSPYALVDTFPAGSDEFEDGTFTHTGDAARAGTKYLVTMYYGSTAALGFFSGSSAPDTADYPGLASTDEQPGDGGSDGLPTWAIVLIVLGILFLVVLVAVLIARGRQGDPQAATTQQTYASWEEPATGTQAGASGEVHQARCPACATSFTVTGTKPVITVCPGCGKKGILR